MHDFQDGVLDGPQFPDRHQLGLNFYDHQLQVIL